MKLSLHGIGNGIGDIVPAELQDAPDYSASAPLFLYSLNQLADGASYYNPTQAAQDASGGNGAGGGSNANPLNGSGYATPPSYYDSGDSTMGIIPATGSIAAETDALNNGNGGGNAMTVDQAICQQIQCGALTQSQAGPDLVAACSAAGYVGARSCNDPVCDPYTAAMIANGVCPPVYPTASPIPTPSATLPSATTAPMPSIIATAPVVAPMPVITVPIMQQRMPQIVNTTPAVLTQASCDNSFAQWVSDNPLLALAGLAAVAYVCANARGGKGDR